MIGEEEKMRPPMTIITTKLNVVFLLFIGLPPKRVVSIEEEPSHFYVVPWFYVASFRMEILVLLGS
jgi:hypothetical protein